MIFNKVKELKKQGLKIGITFSAFDLLHAGHIAMLAEAKNHCDYLIAALQTDPTIDRQSSKNPPIQSIVERQIQLSTNRNVDEVVVYQTEKDVKLFKKGGFQINSSFRPSGGYREMQRKRDRGLS